MQNRSINTIARTLIQTVVRQKLTAIKNDPERSLRSLVDMGLNFAGGGEQQHILQLAQQTCRMKAAPTTASSTIWPCTSIPTISWASV